MMMTTKFLRPSLGFVAGCLAAFLANLPTLAAPLTATTAVHTKPDASSPTITFLKAGTEPTPAADAIATTPAGWLAVELPGPFEGYVQHRDMTKSLDVKEGVPIRMAPKADAGVLTIAQKGDKTSITGLHGRWTQISLEKPLVGYIQVAGETAPAPAPVATQTPPPAAPPISPAPVAPAAYGTGTAGQAAPMVNLGDGGSSTLPRQFAGRFVSTRRPLRPRRPYDYALEDDAGKRYAYLDVSKLLLTEQIEKYIDHNVVVFGAAKSSADGKDIVITVETLRLK